MIRLSVDTSFEHLGLCLTRNGVALANYYSLCHRRNATIIFEVIDDLLKSAELSLAEVDAYVVNCGPGSYTGVRIGMSVTKTFAQVHDKPVIPVNSLELLAGQIRHQKNDFPVLLNCTRREIFHSVFRIVDDHPVAQTAIQLTSQKNSLKSQAVFRLSIIASTLRGENMSHCLNNWFSCPWIIQFRMLSF